MSTFTLVFLLVVVILVVLGVIKFRDEKKRIIGPGWLIALAVVVGLFLMLIIAATALSADDSRFTFLDEITVVHLRAPIKYEDTKITILETTQPLSGDEQWVFITDLSGREWMIPTENIAFTVKESRFMLAE